MAAEGRPNPYQSQFDPIQLHRNVPKANTREIFELWLKRPEDHLCTRHAPSILPSTHLFPQTNTRERGWGGEGDSDGSSSDSAVNRTRLLKQQQQNRTLNKTVFGWYWPKRFFVWNVTARCSDRNSFFFYTVLLWKRICSFLIRMRDCVLNMQKDQL